MDRSEIDPTELAACLGPALDELTSHSIATQAPLDRGHFTLLRGILEERVMLALECVDSTAMPSGWQWQKAAEVVALQVGREMINLDQAAGPAADR